MKPSEYFADVMQKNYVIAVDEYELYQYSLNALFEMAGNIIFSILIGVLFHKLPMTLLFLMVVIPGRSVLGGCHAKTAGACFVLVAKRSFWLCFASFLSHRDIGMDC